MKDIHCPKDIGFNNIFIGEDCKLEQRYDNCYHCWSSAIAENNQKYFKRKFEEELEKLKAEFEEDKYILLNQITAIKIIDNKISELKENRNDM